MQHHLPQGFTLLELIITIAIIGLLLTLTLPNYQHYSTKATSLAAQHQLIEIMQLQNQYFSNHASYTTKLAEDLEVNPNSDTGDYYITARPCYQEINQCVELNASPLRDGLPPITLDSLGNTSPDSVWR